MDSDYLVRLGDWLVDVELRLGSHCREDDDDVSLQELKEAIGTAQVAVARMLAERRLLA